MKSKNNFTNPQSVVSVTAPVERSVKEEPVRIFRDVIGAGAIVTKDVDPYSTVAGGGLSILLRRVSMEI